MTFRSRLPIILFSKFPLQVWMDVRICVLLLYITTSIIPRSSFTFTLQLEHRLKPQIREVFAIVRLKKMTEDRQERWRK